MLEPSKGYLGGPGIITDPKRFPHRPIVGEVVALEQTSNSEILQARELIIYVYMYICIHVYMYICIYVCMYVWMYGCVYIYI